MAMAQAVSPHCEMAQARQGDDINVIFDEQSPALSRSRSCSSSSHYSSRRYRGRDAHRGRYRSPSFSSSSSRSTSRSSRSRSHPRCHRHSSRCRCSNHRRYQRRQSRRSPPRHYRAHSRSFSRSPSLDRYQRRRYRSQSRSSKYSRYNNSRGGKYQCQFSRSPPRSFRGRSRSRSLECSIALSVEAKRHLLEAARQKAMKNLGVQRLELPESVKPFLMMQSTAFKCDVAAPKTWVRRNSENASQQSTEVEDAEYQRLSPKRGISFSSNNSVAKPAVCTQSCAKVTSLVDSVESKKPYGHWIPVKSARH